MNERSTPASRSCPGRPNRGRWSAAVALPVVAAVVMTGVGYSQPGSGATTTTTGTRSTTRPVAVWGQPAPAGVGVLEAVSCGDAKHCWAVGQGAINPPTGTTTSTTPSAPASPSTPVSIAATADGGHTWSVQQAPATDPTDLTAIDCPDARHCMAVGTADHDGPILGAIVATNNGGRSWQELEPPASSVDLLAVHCFNDDDCIVMATDGSSYWSASTMDGGRVWQRGGSLPPGFGGITNLSCVDTTNCATVGYASTTPGQGSGAAAVTDDGGATWTAATLPDGVGVLHGISCTADATCVAVGTKSTTLTDVALAPSQILISGDGGDSWTLSGSPSGVGDAFGVSCTTGHNCVTVGTVWTVTKPPTPIGGIVTSVDGGLDWRTAVDRYVPVGLVGVDCPVPTACVAAGNDVLARMALPAPKVARPGTGPGATRTTGTSRTGAPGRR